MKTKLVFHILDCNVPFILGLSLLQMVNPIMDWMDHSVQVSTLLGFCPLKVIGLGLASQYDAFSAK